MNPLLLALPAFLLGVVLALGVLLWVANGKKRVRLVVLRSGRVCLEAV